MEKISLGDIVLTKNDDVIYEVIGKEKENITLRGVFQRIIKVVNESDIIKENINIDKEKLKEKSYYYKVFNYFKRNNTKYLPGKILHIDGDQKYLDKCLELYDEVGLYAFGVMIKESKMPSEVLKYLDIVNPDIIVITGHDLYNNNGIKDINNYTNSKYYIETIKNIRKTDKMAVIVAGACQSNFEALIASGANFASSPKRINIHTFDPAVIAIRAATTSFMKVVEIEEILKYIENGKNAFNGVETLGKMRLIL